MNKTGQQIEDDIFGMVKTGPLASLVNGVVYKFGTRPRDSQKEDIIVKFVEGFDGQIQDGTVVVNIYVPNVDSFPNGVFVRNITRLKAIEIAADAWVRTLTTGVSDYRFRLSHTIQTVEDFDINQHFVTIRLKFQLSTF
jgi:hypothetical protein